MSDNKMCGAATADRYEEDLTKLRAELASQAARFEEHTKAVGDFLREMYAIMVDPIEDSGLNVTEMCSCLRNRAEQDLNSIIEQRAQLASQAAKIEAQEKELADLRATSQSSASKSKQEATS